jgi:hypothetical protein
MQRSKNQKEIGSMFRNITEPGELSASQESRDTDRM